MLSVTFFPTSVPSAEGSLEQMLPLVYSSVSVLMFLYTNSSFPPAGLLMERKHPAPLLFAFFSWCSAMVAQEGLHHRCSA